MPEMIKRAMKYSYGSIPENCTGASEMLFLLSKNLRGKEINTVPLLSNIADKRDGCGKVIDCSITGKGEHNG